jgi:hypothetical protein
MSKQRNWFWQIEEMGNGPDYFFCATFDKSDTEHLAALVRQHLPSIYVQNTEQVFPGKAHCSGCTVYESYCDQHTYDRALQMKQSGRQESIYYYAEIQVCDHQLCIDHVLSGGIYDDTALVIALAQSSDLTLNEWTIGYKGYSSGEVARGTSALSLLAYLQRI